MSINLTVAKNEYEPAQVLLRSSSAFSIQSVSFTPLTGSAGTIASSNLRANFVEYEYFTQNTGASGGCSGPLLNPVRKSPAYFPEGLSNETQMAVTANTTQPIWIRLYVPAGTATGFYSGIVSITTSVGTATVPISAYVNAVVLPNPNVGSFALEFVIHPWNLTQSYGYTENSSQWWAVWDNIATILRENRVNILSVDTQYLRDRDSGGWAVFDRYVQLFIDKGGVRRLFGMPLGSRNLHQKVTELDAHLKAKGWYKMWYQKIMDEPFSEAQKTEYQRLSAIVHQASPDMKRGDGIGTPNGLEDALEVWIPSTWVYEENKPAFNEKRSNHRNELWLYTCCSPTWEWLNRFIDERVFHGELLGWYAFREDIVGYLHWGLMAWNGPDAENFYTSFLGDAYSIHPDINGRVKSSIRMEAMREASEAHELLRILEKKDSALATSIANSVVSNGNGWQGIGYLNEINQIQSYRNQLVQESSK